MKKSLKNYIARFGLVFLGLAILPVACGPTPQDLEKAVGDYIQKNPKVIQDAVRAQRPGRRPEPPLEERIKSAIEVPLNNAPVKGSENAPVTIVEFSDFQCPFCSRVVPTLKQIEEEYKGKVKIAFRQNPLPFHQNAMSAAKAALAAKEQGKFWEMHDALFADQRNLTEDNIRKIAEQIGLNVSKFESDWKSDKFNAQIEEDIKFAQQNGASGTPSFFINGVSLKGAQPYPKFKELIDKLLAGS